MLVSYAPLVHSRSKSLQALYVENYVSGMFVCNLLYQGAGFAIWQSREANHFYFRRYKYSACVIKFGNERRIPIGIVFETNKPHQLCEGNRQVTTRSRPISEFLDALLARSDYAWSVEDRVIVVHPTHVADQLSRVLNMKFKEFGSLGPPPIAMQGLGIILANWVYGRLHPEVKGFAGSILSSPDAEQFSNLYVQNASLEQILNRIVSLGSKGMWFFRLSRDFERKKDINLYTYSYKGDANAIQTICSAGSY